MQYAKSIAAAVAAILAAVVPAFYGSGPIGLGAWVNVVLLACGAVQIFNSKNIAGWDYAKLVAAVVTAAGVAMASALSDADVSRAEWIQVAIAALGAFVVYRIPNTQPPGRHEAPKKDWET